MYKGLDENRTNTPVERAAKPVRRRKKLNKFFLITLSVVLLLSIVGGATIAYLTSTSEAVKNSFQAAQVSCQVDFETNPGSVINTSNVPVYIRLAVVTSWQNQAGEQYAYATKISDLEITIYEGSGWSRHSDGYFYYSEIVQPGDSTTVLGGMDYQNLVRPAEIPAEYNLVVELFAEAIQAQGDDGTNSAHDDAWANVTTGGAGQ